MEDSKRDKETSSNTPKHGDRIVGFGPRFGGIRWRRRRRIKRRQRRRLRRKKHVQ